MNISMRGIDHRDPRMFGVGALKTQGDNSRRTRLLGWSIVPHRDHERTITSSCNQRRTGVEFDSLVAEIVQKLERIERRLWDAVCRNQSEAAIKRRLHHTLLFEHVGKCPVSHDV